MTLTEFHFLDINAIRVIQGFVDGKIMVIDCGPGTPYVIV